MKFEKFVKSLGVNGVIHERKENEKWISGFSVSMKIPEQVTGVMGKAIVPMPEKMDSYINFELSGIPCYLSKAIMPAGDSGVKDCIRIFTSDDRRFECGIRNNDFALIEKSDLVEMYVETNDDTFEEEVKVLLIKRFLAKEQEPELIGLIFTYKYEEQKL